MLFCIQWRLYWWMSLLITVVSRLFSHSVAVLLGQPSWNVSCAVTTLIYSMIHIECWKTYSLLIDVNLIPIPLYCCSNQTSLPLFLISPQYKLLSFVVTYCVTGNWQQLSSLYYVCYYLLHLLGCAASCTFWPASFSELSCCYVFVHHTVNA